MNRVSTVIITVDIIAANDYNGVYMVGHDDKQRDFRIGITRRQAGETIFYDDSNL